MIVVLCSVMQFGNAFTGNAMSPLQKEIEAHLNIDDSQFNLLFSARAITSIVFPFGLPLFLEKAGTRNTTIMFVGASVAGQYMLIYGIHIKNYPVLILSRLVFGLSDLVPIMQQIIMCLWFTAEQLPIAVSLLLFLTKMARAVSDNIASMVYNYNQNLESFFYIGLIVCALSLLSAVVLTEIHARLIDSQTIRLNEAKAK